VLAIKKERLLKRKSRVTFLAIALFALVSVALSGCGQKQSAEKESKETAQAVKTIRLSCAMPATYPQYKEVENFAKLVNERSKGALKVEIYPTATLYKDADAVEAAASGAVEMISVPYFYVARIVPQLRLFELPYLITKDDVWFKIYDGEIGKKIAQQLEAKGLKLLGWGHTSTNVGGFETKKPVYVPGDMKGMKIRSASTTDAAIIAACGATPVPLSASDLYMALQRGTVDGALGSPSHITDRKLYEVTNYMVNLKSVTATWMILINKKFFDGLSPELQKIVIDAGREVDVQSRPEWTRMVEEEWVPKAKEHGFTFIDPTPEQMVQWQKVFDQVYEKVYKEVPELKELVAEVRKLEKE